ncbi:Fpg/Nei family DNA glycosylase [Streptomyces sp. 7-21]|uniref:Fpg/Nei family DNA glycosylase n=1 Tax=Streptomyces sp. 7-21 TaxID=2802283 RepID=UPI00191C9C04|nr:DNA-formamidopyrimidine glycosylase family protein [Streptomyces sp. 7-21]MBL1068774.1 Fpg/Nei family DNA glycosylase [Streptomyces sp. 7-21]
MPELPDVEGFSRTFAACARGRRVTGVTVADAGVLHQVSAAGFRRALTGRRFRAPRRHGKWLLAPTDGPEVVLLHFGMTGRLVCGTDPAPHDRITFTLEGGRVLRYRDQRKLRGIWLVRSGTQAQRVMGRQGPDALALAPGELGRLLAGRRGGLKSALLDQSLLAGLGNLLADEVLWRARLHPARPAAGLAPAERQRLERALRTVLGAAVPAGRVPDGRGWLTGRRGRPDPACPRCGTPLARTRVAGRTTVWCPRCQPQPDGRRR